MSVIISNTPPINYLVLIDHIAVLHQLPAFCAKKQGNPQG